MAYIGTSPAQGVRRIYNYTATASQTSFSGNDTLGISLAYADGAYIDVYQNGVLLIPTDYVATTGTTVVLDTGAAVNDTVQMVVYDVFSVADTVSAKDGGNFGGDIGMGGTLTVTGVTTLSQFRANWQSVVTGATVTAVAGRGYAINTTSQACTVTLPSSASVGDSISIVDYVGTFATNEVILTSSLKIQGQTANAHLTTNREGVTLTYVDATQGWVSTSGVNSGTQSIDYLSYPADFLVVAGGGAGGAQHGGGGGGGGYRNSYASEASGGGASSETSLTLVPETVYTVTVGGGGAAKAAGSTNNNVGANSVISGSGITSVGGGGGASWGQVGTAGGSGGGDAGSPVSSALAGTANQGFAGGVLGAAGAHGGGGGGGAGAVGANSTGDGGSNSQAGNGGAGLTSVINGSTGRGGGGGGGTYTASSSVATGSHGGGNGGLNGTNSGTVVQPVAGTANTGGGGGSAQKDSVNGAAGGSGVVILRIGTVFYSGTTSGSPTVSTSGTDTILTFNGSGSYTG